MGYRSAGSMSAKTILIAHRSAAVRERFAAALADGRHAFVAADTETAARAREAVFQVEIDVAEKWARDMGRVGRKLPGSRISGDGEEA